MVKITNMLLEREIQDGPRIFILNPHITIFFFHREKEILHGLRRHY